MRYPSFTQSNIFHKSHLNELAFPAHLTQVMAGTSSCAHMWAGLVDRGTENQSWSVYFCADNPGEAVSGHFLLHVHSDICWIIAGILCQVYVLLSARGEWKRQAHREMRG